MLNTPETVLVAEIKLRIPILFIFLNIDSKNGVKPKNVKLTEYQSAEYVSAAYVNRISVISENISNKINRLLFVQFSVAETLAKSVQLTLIAEAAKCSSCFIGLLSPMLSAMSITNGIHLNIISHTFQLLFHIIFRYLAISFFSRISQYSAD